jgi:hypothetical protein
MERSRLLTAAEAEAVVDDCIEVFGLGALPRVHVAETGPATWHVRWEHRELDVPPMTRDEWRAWLEENVGSLDAERLETSES